MQESVVKIVKKKTIERRFNKKLDSLIEMLAKNEQKRPIKA